MAPGKGCTGVPAPCLCLGHYFSLFFLIEVKFIQHKINNFKVNNWVVLSKSQCCATTTLYLTFLSLEVKTLYPFSAATSPWQHQFAVSMDLLEISFILEILYK